MVDKANWEWYGHAGHFICAQWCRFHLCTKVGNYIVSTIGEYVPDEGVREILANSRKIPLEGRGDARLNDYMKKIGFQPMGAGPYPYETLVFEAGKPCSNHECGCGGVVEPKSWSELDGMRSMTAGEARATHLEYCTKYSTGGLNGQ